MRIGLLIHGAILRPDSIGVTPVRLDSAFVGGCNTSSYTTIFATAKLR